MNIWSFPPEPVTDGPLKLRDTALCLWHCGIYRRKKIKLLRGERTWNSKHCVLAVYLFRGLSLFQTSWPQMFRGNSVVQCLLFLEMIVSFNVFLFFPLTWTVCCANAAVVSRKKKNFTFPQDLCSSLCPADFSCCFFTLSCTERAHPCLCVRVCVLSGGNSSSTGGLRGSNLWNSPTWDQMERKIYGALAAFQLILHLRLWGDEKW